MCQFLYKLYSITESSCLSLMLKWAKNEPKRAKFWLDFGSFFGSKIEPSQARKITELERAEPKSHRKFPSPSEPSRILSQNFRARASRAGSNSAGSSQNSSRATARSTSNLNNNILSQFLFNLDQFWPILPFVVYIDLSWDIFCLLYMIC